VVALGSSQGFSRAVLSKPRMSQPVRDGHLKPSADDSINAKAVENCRRHAPVAWQVSALKSGRKSAAQH
jgi:hypothetical protein